MHTASLELVITGEGIDAVNQAAEDLRRKAHYVADVSGGIVKVKSHLTLATTKRDTAKS